MRALACLAVGVVTLGGALAGAVPAEAGGSGAHRTVHPAFQATACPDDVFPPDSNVDCGFITVPEDRSHPHGRQIEVAAAVMHTASSHPADPIVFLDGGPSFPAISGFAPGFYFDDPSYIADRDVILVDTRGTGQSQPNLGCPELDQAEVDAFYSAPTINSQALPIYNDALQHCRDRLVSEGVDPAAYTTAESAADLDALRRALGVRQWNLMALSADGSLGLTYMRMFPGGIRSAVIDSGMSTQMLWGLDYDRGMARELESIFAGCAANAACNAKYPGIRSVFFAMVSELNQHPATISFPDFQPHPVTLELDGVGLYADAIYNIFPGDKFDPSEIPDLLSRIWRETHGELVDVYHDLLGNGPVENGHRNDVFAQGKTMSYVCHDSVGFITAADLRQAARDLPPFAARYLDPGFDLADGFTAFVSPAGCRVWNVGVAPRRQHMITYSGIPTLVLAGQYDAGVPPYIVRQVMAGLPHGHYYEFPAAAHLQLASYNNDSDCARGITAQFLSRPAASINSSCIATLAPVDFTP